MLVNLNVPLLDIHNQPVVEKGVEVSAKAVVVTALLAAFSDEAGLSVAEKVQRFALAVRLQNASAEVDVSLEDLVLIKKLVGKAYSPLIVGRVYEILPG